MTIFQKKRHNGCTNRVEVSSLISTLDFDLCNGVRSNERQHDLKYSKVVEDPRVAVLSPDNNRIFLDQANPRMRSEYVIMSRIFHLEREA
jgi:hypothetical protein